MVISILESVSIDASTQGSNDICFGHRFIDSNLSQLEEMHMTGWLFNFNFSVTVHVYILQPSLPKSKIYFINKYYTNLLAYSVYQDILNL